MFFRWGVDGKTMSNFFSLAVSGVLVLMGALGSSAFAGPNDDILAASKAGDKGGVEAALAQGASVNAVDEDPLTPDNLGQHH